MAEQQPRAPDAAGIPWYRRADYKRILEIMVDREKLPPAFDKWQSQAERREAEVKRSGIPAVRAYIDPEHFVTWCAGTNRDVDAKARIAWANLVAYRSVRGDN